MAKKCIALQMGVIYDSQVTNRKQGGHPVRAPWRTPIGRLEVIYSMNPSQPEYTKTPPQTGGSSYFLIEKSLKTA
jgi:hypothetical protein